MSAAAPSLGVQEADGTSPILQVENLTVQFNTYHNRAQVVSEVSMAVRSGGVVGVVGETGSGKSMFVLGLLGLLPSSASVVAGSVHFDGVDLLHASRDLLRSIRGGALGFIPPNPRTSLDPVGRIGDTLVQLIRAHQQRPRNEAEELAIEMLSRVGIPDPTRRMRAYPFELSGGMAQRVAIAMALANRPKLLLADEPTSGLDVTVQSQVLDLLTELTGEGGAGMLMVTRDLAIVAHHCETVTVMYAGWAVEQSPVREFFSAPLHPYSTAILSAVSLKRRRTASFALSGSMPRFEGRSPGCVCVDRCSLVEPVCHTSMPEPVELSLGRTVRCHVLARDAGMSG